MENRQLSQEIIGAAFDVYSQMGFGYLESVYERCLTIELQKRRIQAQFQVPLDTYYNKQIVGSFIADIIVENSFVVELKSVRRLSSIHEVQLVNYLKCTGFDHGLLLNFGEQKVEVKRKVRELSLILNKTKIF